MTASFSYPAWNILRFDRTSKEPLHEQLFNQIRAAIAGERIVRGARLPPSRQLATELGVSRNTVVNVYDRLAAEGYIRHRAGAGTFIEMVLPEDHRVKGSGGDSKARTGRMLMSARGKRMVEMGIPWGRIDRFDLGPGTPALDEFPFETFAMLSGRHWRSHPASELGYGEPGGLRALREQIAIYLGEARGVACEPDQVIVVNHTLQAITLLSQILLDPGDGVIVEDPSYITELATLTASGVRPISIAVDNEGLDIASAGEEARRARLAAVTPVGQVPFGSSMGPARRDALIAWAHDNDAWIFEDDFNSEIRWAGQPQPPLASLDRKGHVIYSSSLNRILAPGLRLGYVVVPPDLIEAFTVAQQAMASHVPLPLQHVVADFMAQGHLASHMRRMRPIYRERAMTLSRSLREEFGDLLDVPDVDAGLYLTAVSRIDFDDVAASNAALRHQLDVPPLSRYSVSGRPRKGFVFGFGNTPVSRIPRAVKTLANVVFQINPSLRPTSIGTAPGSPVRLLRPIR